MNLEAVKKEHEAMTNWNFLYGRTPEFTHRLSLSIPSRTLDIALKVHEGLITRVDVEMEPLDFDIQNALSLALVGQPYHADTIALTLKAQEDLIVDLETQAAFAPIRNWLSESVHS